MAVPSEKIRLLSGTELFAPLAPEVLRALSRYTSFYRFSEGKAVFKSGDPGDALFIVRSGEISISRSSQDGPSQEIARFVSGDSFGELDLMTGTPRNAEARAAVKSELLRFPRRGKKLKDLLDEMPEAGARLLQSFLEVTAGRIRNANTLLKDNSPWVKELRNQVYGDKLTGLYNKTFLEERLPDYLKDKKNPLALLMVKPDNFKLINDTYGHEAGDQALVIMAGRLRSHLPERAVAVKYMGNELACLLPGTDREKARETAESIRDLYHGLDLGAVTGGVPFTISVSIGIGVYPEHGETGEELLAAAHELPLLGRARGGNKILFPEDK
jgi:diguanylate cyclase (GGDEF)-like protein